jgi:hypothetical protein
VTVTYKIIGMIPNNLHDPDFWLQELDPLLRDLDFAFQLAVPQAHRFFTDFHKKQINKPLLSNLIRYHALEYLWSQGFDKSNAKEEEGDGWGFRGLPNNGIELLFRQSCIRVRKGIEPPYPTTDSSEDFYQQELFQEEERGVVTNLLVLYNLNSKLEYDGNLRLMRPVKLNSKRRIVKCDWQATVQRRNADIGHQVPPEYMHGKDLPFGDEAESMKKTGTDKA